MFPVSLSDFQPYLLAPPPPPPPPSRDHHRSVSAPPSISPLLCRPALNLNASTLSSLTSLVNSNVNSSNNSNNGLASLTPPSSSSSSASSSHSASSSTHCRSHSSSCVGSSSCPALSSSLAASSSSRSRTLRALSVDDDDDDDLNIDTSNMTQDEKNELKAQRKARKMNREKLKRSRVNDQFDHLCRVLHVGKTTRVEKLTVLNETLRTVYQLKAENRILKEQTRQMKELLARRNSNDQGAPSGGSSTQDGKTRPQHPAPKPRVGRGARQQKSVEAAPVLESVVGPLPKDEPFLMGRGPVKQEMMNIGGHEMFLKHDNVLPKQVPDEESMLAFNMMFEQPNPNDLDFAFGGDNNFGWMKPPMPGPDGIPRYPIESECDFNPFVLPKPDHDNMDMFLSSADDMGDLLC